MLEIIQYRINLCICISKITITVIMIDSAIQRIADECKEEEQLLNIVGYNGANDTRRSYHHSRIECLEKFRNELVEEKEHLLTLKSELDRLPVATSGDSSSNGEKSMIVELLVQANCFVVTAILILSNIDKSCVIVNDTFACDAAPEIEKMLEAVAEYRVSATELKDACYKMSEYLSQMKEKYLFCEERLTSVFDNCLEKKDIPESGTAMQSRDDHSFQSSAASSPSMPAPYPMPAVDNGQTDKKRNKPEANQYKKTKITGFFGLFKRKTKAAVNVQTEQHSLSIGSIEFGNMAANRVIREKIVPPPHIDSVQFSAIAADRVIPGKYLPVNIVMYEDAFRKSVDDIVRTHGKNVKEAKSGYHDVERYSSIKVVLSSDDVTVEDGEAVQKWSGKYLNFEFTVKVPKDFEDDQILLTATVYINDIIATKLKLILDCDRKHRYNISVTREDIVSAFVSYASQDRNRVAFIIQGMKKVRPDMDIFFDIESLRSGQRWEEVLKREIENRDVLFLCWSRYARESKWVDMEWRYALESKGEDSIEPIPIEPPDICPPPIELQQKHFNDKMLFIIKATMPTEAERSY